MERFELEGSSEARPTARSQPQNRLTLLSYLLAQIQLSTIERSEDSATRRLGYGRSGAFRLWEVDFARGTGIIMMLISNFVTDLQFFNNYSAHGTFWWAFARATAFVFLFIVGISLTISYSKNSDFGKFLKRGIFIFALGLIITLATWFFIPTDYIRFGVLHLIGISIILSYPFLKLDKSYALLTGLISIASGWVIKIIPMSTNYLLFLGFTTQDFSSLDFFPIFPWFGAILLGLAFGKIVYSDGKRKFKIPDFNLSKPISFLGRNSLLVYFIHQPLFLLLIWLLL